MSKRTPKSRQTGRPIAPYSSQVKPPPRRRAAAPPRQQKPAAKRPSRRASAQPPDQGQRPQVATPDPAIAYEVAAHRARVLAAIDAAAEQGATLAAVVMRCEQWGMSAEQTKSAIGAARDRGEVFRDGDRLYTWRSAPKPGDQEKGPVLATPPPPAPGLAEYFAEARTASLGLPSEVRMDELHKLALTGLYAVAFGDGADADPLGAMLREIADHLSILECLKLNVEKLEIEPTDLVLDRFYFRLSQRARIAEELYRRQGAALLEVVSARLAGGAT